MMTPAPLWNSEEVIAATLGSATGGTDAWTATGVSIDSRTCQPGDLYVSISGDQFDGHDFVAGALESGACAAIVTRRPDGLGDDAPLVQVDDAMDALEALGRAARDRAAASVIGGNGFRRQNRYERSPHSGIWRAGRNPCDARQPQQSHRRAVDARAITARRPLCRCRNGYEPRW